MKIITFQLIFIFFISNEINSQAVFMPALNSDCNNCQLNDSFMHIDTIHFNGGNICCDRNYKIVLSDDFDGTVVDSNKWNTCYIYNDYIHQGTYEGAINRIHGNGGSYYKDENVTVGNGICTLHTKIETITYPTVHFPNGTSSSSKFFTSGMLMSKEYFTDYHRYEIKCKVPSGDDQWPSFWIFGWSTEIDIFEFIDSHNPEFSLHKWKSDQTRYSTMSGMIDFGNLYNDFHTYAVETDKFFVRWYIDDILVYSASHFQHLNNIRNFDCDLHSGKDLFLS